MELGRIGDRGCKLTISGKTVVLEPRGEDPAAAALRALEASVERPPGVSAFDPAHRPLPDARKAARALAAFLGRALHEDARGAFSLEPAPGAGQ